MARHGTVLEQAAWTAAGESGGDSLHHLQGVPKPVRAGFARRPKDAREEHAMQLTGIHHLTAISAKPRDNLAFYTGLLGMRLVKKTVNQDDVSAYHLFYADGKANPGTDLTFFDFPAAPERRGSNSISRTGLRVAGENSLGFWRDRLKKAGGHTGEVIEVDGRLTLPFEDQEGQRLVLIDDGGAGPTSPWEKSTVPVEHQIRGLGPIVLNVRDLARTAYVLTEVMNMRRVRDYAAPDAAAQIHVFAMGEGGPAAELHVIEQKDLPVAGQGAGGVHHVAFRTPDEQQYHAWTRRLTELRIPNSGEIDRFYFRSLYFREPNGILFEIATDGPGFATDESLEKLGEKLALPPFLEPRRAQIEAGLKPIG
jgi:glyoxalase family protein